MAPPSTFPAVIAYQPTDLPHPIWKHQSSISLPSSEPGPNEVLVRMVATGVCHSDVWVSAQPDAVITAMGMSFPRVLGHEGAGFVEATGSAVTNAKVGDPVLLSYDYCGKCGECVKQEGNGTSCDEFGLRNTVGAAASFRDGEEDLRGKFFGQSSFAQYSMVEENCVVNVKGLAEEDELKVLAPLGCGLMTGSGAVVNVRKPGPDDGVLVTGIGAVGLGAIMAAKIQGVKTIVALDRVKSRLEIAKEVGATHVVDTTGVSMDAIATKIAEAIGETPLKFAIETTGVPRIIEQVMQALAPGGKHVQIGIPPMDGVVNFRLVDIAFQRKTFEWNILGDSISREALPRMIKWWRDGKFPVEKLCKFFKASEAEEALKGMEDGSAIKPVLVW